MSLEGALLARCQEAGISLAPEAAAALSAFHALLLDWNERMDLTAAMEPREMVDRHYVDSLFPLKHVHLLPQGAAVIDVGSGAGFPGLPLAVARPDLRFTLLDAQQKRVRFLQEAVSLLSLGNVDILHARAEDAARLPAYRERFDVSLARAVAPLPVLLEYLLPFVVPGGRALCWKGPAVSRELPPGRQAARLLGGLLEDPIPTPFPGQERAHLLLPCKKIQKTARQYPRKAGTPSRSPLGGF